jgi:hypothetical protein
MLQQAQYADRALKKTKFPRPDKIHDFTLESGSEESKYNETMNDAEDSE